jgi:tRNA(fMet)-specific endonuclease VapC
MGLMLDTGVFIAWERAGGSFDFGKWSSYGEVAISVITASELLVGVWRADSEKRRAIRASFVEAILSTIPIKDITLEVSRRHAEMFAMLSKQGTMIGAHDLLIAATALQNGFAILTTNETEFSRIPGLQVLSFSK